jgi:hypothetical protein
MKTLDKISRDVPDIVLHIGGAKCGSSALQTFLTQNPYLQTLEGRCIEYWTISVPEEDGENLVFHKVASSNLNNQTHYLISDALTTKITANCLHKVFNSFISEFSKTSDTIFVFSSEGWGADFQQTNLGTCNCVERDFNISIYLSVRPQIDLLLPVYFQWVLWSPVPTLEECFHRLIAISDWEKQISGGWKLGADSVNIRFTKDIIPDFCQVYRIDLNSITNPIEKRVNTSLPSEVIIFLLRNRSLRNGEHDSDTDFYIEDLINKYEIPTTKADFTADDELINKIENYFDQGNSKIFQDLGDENASAFLTSSEEAKKRLNSNSSTLDQLYRPLANEFLEQLLVASLHESSNYLEVYSSAIAERDSAIAERDSAIAERDSAIAERDSAIAERDSAIAERDSAIAELVRRFGNCSNSIEQF